jgi:hypothetical protein
MSEQQKRKLRLEIGHVLFIDIVGYSKLTTDEQSEALHELNADKEAALEQLEKSVKLPTGITYGELKKSPDWDALRGDPRFEKLVALLAPKDANP